MKSGQIKEITEKATEQLATALKAGHSQTLTDYLKAIGRFHRYSLHNVLLIASQKPNASYVAGFRTWNELGRFVKKGEKGILILAPVVRRKPENEKNTAEDSPSISGFRAAYVFDLSQTDGKELPHIATVKVDPQEHAERLRSFAGTQGIALESFPSRSRPHGASRAAERLLYCRASHLPKNSQRWRTNSHMNSCTAAIGEPVPPAESEKRKRRLPHLWCATP
jgi:hypothetical protein